MGEILPFHQPGILYLSYPTMLSQSLFLIKVVQELFQRIVIIREKEGKASALTALISPVLGRQAVFGSTSTSHSRPLSSPSPKTESLQEKYINQKYFYSTTSESVSIYSTCVKRADRPPSQPHDILIAID